MPIGKLSLYTACGGIDPAQTLPIILDVGTNNQERLDDPEYLGWRHSRISGQEYDDFVDVFVQGVKRHFPHVLLQFEDFAQQHAYPLLERYQNQLCTFNDDIQGTAATGVAGILAALRFKKERLEDQRVLFFGAGSAGIGIADLLCTVMVRHGLSVDEARSRIRLVDSKGLVQTQRTDLTPSKEQYAFDDVPADTLFESVRSVRPTILIGTSTIPKSFTKDVIEEMARISERPIIFPYSNPTSKSECSAEEAYEWTGGRAIFASGSPFPPHTMNGRTFTPGQGNNVYIFPAMGLAVLAANPSSVPDEAFVVAANALAELVTDENFASGLIYPPMASIRNSAMHVATAVATWFHEAGLARSERPADIAAAVRAMSWTPHY